MAGLGVAGRHCDCLSFSNVSTCLRPADGGYLNHDSFNARQMVSYVVERMKPCVSGNTRRVPLL